MYAQADTLDRVLDRDRLHCGVASGLSGFAWRDEDVWIGFDVDFCRGLAASLLGDPQKVRFVPTTTSDRFELLKTGEIDVLARASAWTATRDMFDGLKISHTSFFNGLTVLTPEDENIASLADLEGKQICIVAEDPRVTHLVNALALKSIVIEQVAFASSEDAHQAYEAGRCQALYGEAYSLTLLRAGFAAKQMHRLLWPYIKMEPLGPVVLDAEPRWADMVTWVGFALLAAEERGIGLDEAKEILAILAAQREGTQTVEDLTTAQIAIVEAGRDLLRFDVELRARYDLSPLAPLLQAVAATGNYGQMYQRNFGDLQWERAGNALWYDGGLLYAPDFR